MLKEIINRIRSLTFYPLSQVPPGFFGGGWGLRLSERPDGKFVHRICSPEQALTLSPFWAALRLYQNSVAVLPLVTYRKDANGGRHRYEDDKVFGLLHDRPNAAMSRANFFKWAFKEYFFHGECFAMLQWSNNHRLMGIYPVPAQQVTKVEIDKDWNKTYHVNGYDTPFADDEMIHVLHYSHCGFRGTSFLRYACESLGLHKQVLETATAYYQNAAKPSGYIKYPGKLLKDSKDNVKTGFKEQYQGSGNAGEVPILTDGGEFVPFPSTAADDARIVEQLGASVNDVARWFDNLSPLMLGSLERGTYSNNAADKLAFHQKNLLPVLEDFQCELNYKLFGINSDIYCEFLTDNILRADPLTQAQVWHMGIQDGYLLRSEVREWQNLEPIDGLDTPMVPQNMAETPAEDATDTQPESPNEDATDNTEGYADQTENVSQ